MTKTEKKSPTKELNDMKPARYRRLQREIYGEIYWLIKGFFAGSANRAERSQFSLIRP